MKELIINSISARKMEIENIPAILWGKPSDKIYIVVHGKMSSKESAHGFAEIIGAYVEQNWREINLFGCSLGAYFSLHAYKDFPIKKCLFQYH